MASDAFDALGIPPRFGLAREDIERRYLALVSGAHPDADPGSDAAARTALLNDARAVLLDPERRAAALLARLGGPPPDRDRALPPDFLSEMMDVREELDGAQRSRDPAALLRWRSWAQERRAAFIADVTRAFDALGPSPAGSDLAAIRRSLNAWRYVERMLEQMEDPAG